MTDSSIKKRRYIILPANIINDRQVRRQRCPAVTNDLANLVARLYGDNRGNAVTPITPDCPAARRRFHRKCFFLPALLEPPNPAAKRLSAAGLTGTVLLIQSSSRDSV